MVISHNGTWKTISITLLGMVGTGIGAWLVLGRDNVNRIEFGGFRTEIRTEIRELRAEVTAEINALTTTTSDLSKAVVRLNTILEER